MKKFLFFILFLRTALWAQNPVGSWKDYFSYASVLAVAQAGDQIIACSQNGYFIIYNNEIIAIRSKVNGLSDIGLSAIAYSNEFQTIVCGYENGNIDLIDKQGNVINLPYVKNKIMPVSKKINQIVISGQNAYLATDFGIINIDLSINEIKETYFLSETSSYRKINSLLIKNNTLYAATENGLFFISLEHTPIDFANWTKDIFFSDREIYKIIDFNGELTVLESNSIYRKNGDIWQVFVENFTNPVDMDCSNDKLYFLTENKVSVFNTYGLKVQEVTTVNDSEIKPLSCLVSDDGSIYIGDARLGLIENLTSSNIYCPSSPGSNEIFDVEVLENKIFAVRGGYYPNYSPCNNMGEIYVFENNTWTNLSVVDGTDFVAIAPDPADASHFFVASYGNGLFEFEDNKLTEIYNASNSSLVETENGEVPTSECKFDENGILWVMQKGNKTLHAFDGSQWQDFYFGGYYSGVYLPTELLFSSENYLIATYNYKGFLIFDYNQTPFEVNDDVYLNFIPKDNESGELLGSNLKSADIDKDGVVWFGANDGIAIVYGIDMPNKEYTVSRVKISDVSADTTIINYLLKGSQITKVFIDPAGRKWIGTTQGLYLINASGTEQIYHFTTENSPIPSDYINDLAMNEENGELLIATSQGLVSYFADTKRASADYNKAYVYPNPVPHNYSGNIVITNLVDNTFIKITDIAGNIVYETVSNGGTAVWNGLNFDGKRPATGVYLIFLTNPEASESKVLKLMFYK